MMEEEKLRQQEEEESQYDEDEEDEEEEEEDVEDEDDADIPSAKKSPSNYSSMSYELYVEQKKGEQDDNKEEASRDLWEQNQGPPIDAGSRRESNHTISSNGGRKVKHVNTTQHNYN